MRKTLRDFGRRWTSLVGQMPAGCGLGVKLNMGMGVSWLIKHGFTHTVLRGHSHMGRSHIATAITVHVYAMIVLAERTQLAVIRRTYFLARKGKT